VRGSLFYRIMPPSDPDERVQRLLKQEAVIKNRIQQAKAQLRTRKDKIRTGRLIAWGVVIEQKLKLEELNPDDWATECRRLLSDPRTLERALADFIPDTDHDSTP